MEQDPPVSALTGLVEELETANAEHPDVAVSDESGWTLSAFRDGRLVWENIEDEGAPRHLEGVERADVIQMFEALAAGDIAAVETQPWSPGY